MTDSQPVIATSQTQQPLALRQQVLMHETRQVRGEGRPWRDVFDGVVDAFKGLQKRRLHFRIGIVTGEIFPCIRTDVCDQKPIGEWKGDAFVCRRVSAGIYVDVFHNNLST